MSCRRNEPARERRRQKLKDRFSLTSVPISELVTEGRCPSRRLDLNNHFGWTVLDKSQVGDGTFPHLSQTYAKPDISGRDSEKVTYVILMKKGTIVDKETAIKETQTAFSGTLVRGEKSRLMKEIQERIRQEEPWALKEADDEKTTSLLNCCSNTGRQDSLIYEYDTAPEKKRKLISEFYYNPRDRSRSEKRNKSRNQYKAGDSDGEWKTVPQASQDQLSEIEQYVNDDDKGPANQIERRVEDAREKPKKRQGNTQDRWKMRAGAERISGSSRTIIVRQEESLSKVKKKDSSLADDFPEDHDEGINESSPEQLFESSHGPKIPRGRQSDICKRQPRRRVQNGL